MKNINLSEVVATAKSVLTQPASFFAARKLEKGVKKAFWYFAAISLLEVFIAIVSFLIIGSSVNFVYKLAGVAPEGEQSFPQMLPVLVFGYFFGLAFSFVSAGLLHLWIRLFRGKGNYSKTYQLFVYTHTPRALLSWIPVIGGLIAWVYGFVLLVIGAQIFHSISRRRAIVIFIIPFLLTVVLVLFGFIAFLLLLKNIPSGQGLPYS